MRHLTAVRVPGRRAALASRTDSTTSVSRERAPRRAGPALESVTSGRSSLPGQVSAAPGGALPVPTLLSLAACQRLLTPEPRSPHTAFLPIGSALKLPVPGSLTGPGSASDGEPVSATHV